MSGTASKLKARTIRILTEAGWIADDVERVLGLHSPEPGGANMVIRRDFIGSIDVLAFKAHHLGFFGVQPCAASQARAHVEKLLFGRGDKKPADTIKRVKRLATFLSTGSRFEVWPFMKVRGRFLDVIPIAFRINDVAPFRIRATYAGTEFSTEAIEL